MAQCHVCDKYSNQLSYYEFGKERVYVCAGHASDGTPTCDACYKFKKAREEYLDLDDHGRKLCSDCSSIAVIDPKECVPLLHNVREWYKSLNLKLDTDIPFVLVNRDTMLKLRPDHSGHKKTIGTIWRSNSKLRSFLKIKKCSKSEGKIEVEKTLEVLKRAKKLVDGRKSSGVVAMVVLFGRPDVGIGATLAHEMMHVWLRQRLKGCTVDELERSVEEGICVVMGYMWMEWFCSGGFDSSYKTSVQAQYTRDWKDYIAKLTERRDDKIYGQGFRDAMKAVSKFGLKTTLDHIVKNRCLPLVQNNT